MIYLIVATTICHTNSNTPSNPTKLPHCPLPEQSFHPAPLPYLLRALRTINWCTGVAPHIFRCTDVDPPRVRSFIPWKVPFGSKTLRSQRVSDAVRRSPSSTAATTAGNAVVLCVDHVLLSTSAISLPPLLFSHTKGCFWAHTSPIELVMSVRRRSG